MSAPLDALTASHLSPDQLERLRGLLLDERTAQEARAAELQNPIDLEPDLADVLLARCSEAVEEIDAALTRIGAGSYGMCSACGTAIPCERLEIVPAADHCVACQVDRDRVIR